MKKSNKKLIFGAGAIAAAAAALGVSHFQSSHNVPETVYGPPEWFETPAETDPTDAPDETVVVTDPSALEPDESTDSAPSEIFDPRDNVPEEVYGPPEWFGYDDGDDTDGDTDDASDDGFSPDDNIPVAVYGPPEWFERESVDVDEGFDPSSNIQPLVYGPPAWFGQDTAETSASGAQP